MTLADMINDFRNAGMHWSSGSAHIWIIDMGVTQHQYVFADMVYVISRDDVFSSMPVML